MTKKDYMKELAKLIRSILKNGGYDRPRVRLYKELSVECLVYGHRDVEDYVISELKKYPNFNYDDKNYLYWKEDKYFIYISIV